jgi:plasmid stability protein
MKLTIPNTRSDALVRVDNELYEELRIRAQQNERTLSGEARYLLRRALTSEAIRQGSR